MKNLKYNQIVWILVLLIAVTTMLCSCSTQMTFVSKTAPIEDIINYNTLYPMARYDSCRQIKKKFFHGNTLLIYMQDKSYVVIWGKKKKCKFRKNEMLYYKVEKWYSPGFPGSHCKYFLSNRDESIKYSLL